MVEAIMTTMTEAVATGPEAAVPGGHGAGVQEEGLVADPMTGEDFHPDIHLDGLDPSVALCHEESPPVATVVPQLTTESAMSLLSFLLKASCKFSESLLYMYLYVLCT